MSNVKQVVELSVKKGTSNNNRNKRFRVCQKNLLKLALYRNNKKNKTISENNIKSFTVYQGLYYM